MPKPTWMARDAWADAAKSGTPVDAQIRKAFDVEIKADDAASRTLTFTISTGNADRDKDVISPDGWTFTNFKKNPVVLWAHDYSQLPVAKAKRIRIEDGKVKADAEFAPAEVHPFAETVFQLLKAGFLSACSVGFRPKKYAYNADRGGYDIDAAELYEFSIVPVPANAECLLDAKAAGIDLAGLESWAEGVLKGVKHAWVPDSERRKDADDPLIVTPAFVEKLTATMNAVEALRTEHTATLAKIDEALAKIQPPAAPTPKTVDLETDVLMLDEEPADEVGLTADEVRAAIASALKETVTTEVRSAMNALTGRVD